jgi:hypothetical protein
MQSISYHENGSIKWMGAALNYWHIWNIYKSYLKRIYRQGRSSLTIVLKTKCTVILLPHNPNFRITHSIRIRILIIMFI